VIEVGVDVPNASVMVIMHAERFGLSQLHQLRGRIGRGTDESACFLIAKPKTDFGKQRIQAMLATQDGFKIAQYDLTIRGPGDMIGTRQSGLPPFKIGDIIRDECIMQNAKTNVDLIFKEDPQLKLSKHQGIRNRLKFKQSLLRKEILN
jgi:ATP-dependent DNA helicase RecG